jgi:hypothetical protein
MEADFPAAHSMDTHWFAVDRDGHVACFDSGEAGAVPVDAFAGDDAASEVCRRLAGLLPPTEAVYDLRGRTLDDPRLQGGAHCLPSEPDFRVLMFLDSLDPVRADLRAGRAVRAVEVPAAEGKAVLWQRLSKAKHKRLHDAGVCRGCFWHFGPPDEQEEGRWPNPAGLGMFSYSHLTDNWVAGPYGRQQSPRQPVHVDQLPPDVRKLVGQVRFDLRFADAPRIQPVEHTPCESWESAYMDSAGKKIRPIPGKEDEYADVYDELAEGEEFEVEPPPGQE